MRVVDDSCRLPGADAVWLLPEFIDADEEASLLSCIHAGTARWTQLTGRRLQTFGAPPPQHPLPLPSATRLYRVSIAASARRTANAAPPLPPPHRRRTEASQAAR